MTVSASDIISVLRSRKNVLLYGPPGTGKTHLMNEVARSLVAEAEAGAAGTAIVINTSTEAAPLEEKSISSIAKRWVTFHQGYSYEDFVIGMRPAPDGKSVLSLKPRAGVLLELAAEVSNGVDEGLLLIDEINRGNASRIFGEFITLLEDDKRLDSDGSETDTTIPVSLPYLEATETFEIPTSMGAYEQGSVFRMPSKVYTLASMNSVDKSVAPLDTALRRRFHIINLYPSFDDLRRAVGLPSGDTVRLVPRSEIVLTREAVARLAVHVVEKLNRGIGLYMGPEFCLGQWYLARLASPKLDGEGASAAAADIWNYSILPQLIELFHGRNDQLVALLEIDRLGGYAGMTVMKPEGEEEDLGGVTYVQTEPAAADAVLDYLAKFAEAPPEPVVDIPPAAAAVPGD